MPPRSVASLVGVDATLAAGNGTDTNGRANGGGCTIQVLKKENKTTNERRRQRNKKRTGGSGAPSGDVTMSAAPAVCLRATTLVAAGGAGSSCWSAARLLVADAVDVGGGAPVGSGLLIRPNKEPNQTPDRQNELLA